MAKQTHTPTPAMKAAAKKGLQLIKDNKVKEGDVDDLALAGGKKIASGQKLSDDHVRAMASYHDAHAGACPSTATTEMGPAATDDLMWGGPAGAMWANTRVAAMDSTILADPDVDLNKLFDEGSPLSFEIFGSTQGEKIELDEDDDGLLWAPILRSGTLAVRPGPGGKKIHEPLVFVPGHSSDARKEIGLEDLMDAFNAGAVQHVTIPTNHENGVLDNTGFIEAMKMADSTLRPGEKVLMGGHRFTEPDVKDKVSRGTVANRSCGILYDFTNTETGTIFPAVIEHVCLTNRPFVPGMEPYGALQDLDFSDRTVVPMLLSEVPSERIDLDAGGSWDGSAGRFTDAQYQRSCLIKRSGEGSIKERCSLPVREPGGAVSEKGVEAAAAMIGKLKNVSPEEKKAAAKKLVSLYRSLKKDPPPGIAKLASVSTKMSDDELLKELQLADIAWGDGVSLNDIRGQIVDLLRDVRQAPMDEGGYGPHFFVEDVMANPYKARITCDYGFDFDGGDDNWVVPFAVGDDGKVSLSDFSEWLPVKTEWVVDDDARQQSDELDKLLHQPAQTPPNPTDLSLQLPADPLERASQERKLANSRGITTTNPIGGRSMSLTREQIGAMDLSDEARTLLLQDCDEREREKTELSERRKKDKENEVKTYLTELSEKRGLKEAPGFLREVERALLGDDGHVAARLDLSDDGGVKSQEITLSEVVKRIVDALPLGEDGKVDPKRMPTLLQSPIDGRPPQEPEKPEDENKPKTGTQLADEWSKALDGNLDLELAPAGGAPAPADNKGA